MGSPSYRLPWTHWLHLLRPQCKVAGRRSVGRSHQSSRSTSPQRQLQATPRQRLYRSPHQLLLWIAFLQILQCMPYQILWWSQRLWSMFLQLLRWNAALVPVVEYNDTALTPVAVVEHISPDPTVYAAPAPLFEFIAPAPVASFATPVPTVCVAALVVDCASGELRHGAYSVCRTNSCRCRSIMHYTSYLRTKDCTNNGYVTNMLEHITMINIDTGVHMISHNTQT